MNGFMSESEISEMDYKSLRTLKILELIKRKGPISKSDISKELGINPVTVAQYIDKMIEGNMVYEKDYDVSSGGRRPLLIDINAEAAYTMGLSINTTGVSAVVCDLNSKIVSSCVENFKEENVFLSEDKIMSLIEQKVFASSYSGKIKSIALALGGMVDTRAGSVYVPSLKTGRYEYVSVPLVEKLKQKYDIDAIIYNDADAACFAEYWALTDTHVKNMVYMCSGVSCGMMINGVLHRGTATTAGELFIEEHSFDSEAKSSNFYSRCDWDMGIIIKINSNIAEEDKKIKTLGEAFSLNNEIAQNAINDAAEKLGMKIAIVVNMIAPEIVVLGGGLEKGGYVFLEKVRKVVGKYAADPILRNVKIVPSALGEGAFALGAANLALKKIFVSS